MTDLNAKKRADEPPNESPASASLRDRQNRRAFRRRARAEMPESLEAECGSTCKAA
jgi:hypothetical protein